MIEREGTLIPLRGWAAVAGLAAVMVVGSALSFLQAQQAEQRSAAVANTFVGLAHIDAVVPLVVASEDAQRALIATGDPKQRAALDAARARLRANVDAIESNVEPARRADVAELRRRIEAREAAVDRTVQAWLTDGPEAALRLIRAGQGRGAMAQLNQQLDRLRAAERSRLTERTAGARRAASIAAWAPVATAAAALLMLAVCVRMVRDAARARATALAASEAAMHELSFVADAAPVYLAHLDAHERILFSNATFARQFGQTPSDVVGRHAADIVGPGAYAVLRPHMQRALAGEVVEVVLTVPMLDLGARDLMCLCVPERAADGTVAGFVAAVTDITRARRIERKLEASEQRFTVLAEFVPVIVWSMRPDGTNEWVNRAWYDYTGFPRDRPTDEMWSAILHPDDVPAARDAWARAVAAPAPMEMNYRLRRADGEYRWFVGRIAPQFDEQGRVAQWFGTAADIQDAKETERLLREQQRLLRDADRRKDEFIATLAHELRNPLAPIRSAATVLRLTEADANARDRAAAVIQRQVATMALLLDDLLDVSRITRGTLKLHRRRVPLAEVLDSAVEIARPLMDARGHRLTVERPDPDVELDVDALRLSQVIANLLTNAAKYTDRGGAVRLVAAVERDRLRVAVYDTGIGLAPESQREIFRMFSQVRSSLDRSEGGLGIGLALVKGLVELHGGTITAHSEGLGHGSEFRVTLPRVVTRELPREAPVPAPRPDSGAPRRVLVADDSRDGAETLAMLLRLDGHEVRVAHDGLEALNLLREYRPDVALLDIGMPSMNGYEIVGAIRGEPWRRRAMLVAITGWGQDEDKRRALTAGFDVHLTKPVEPELLEQVFRRLREPEPLAQAN